MTLDLDNDSLLRSLETKQFGRPLALGTVLQDALANGEMMPLQQFYMGKLSGQATPEMLAEGATQLSAQMPANYSPTAFMVQAMVDEPLRTMDFVATLAFVTPAAYTKAKGLSGAGVP